MSDNPAGGGGRGASVGEKVKGAFEHAREFGDTIRGSAMDFVDTATGTAGRRRHTETAMSAQRPEGMAPMERSHRDDTTQTDISAVGMEPAEGARMGAGEGMSGMEGGKGMSDMEGGRRMSGMEGGMSGMEGGMSGVGRREPMTQDPSSMSRETPEETGRSMGESGAERSASGI